MKSTDDPDYIIYQKKIFAKIEKQNAEQNKKISACLGKSKDFKFYQKQVLAIVKQKSLSERKNIAIMYKNFFGFTHKEIAKELGCSIHTIQSMFRKKSN